MAEVRRHYILLTLVVFLLGLLAALAYRTNVGANPASAPGDRQSRLVDIFETLEEKRERLAEELVGLREEVSELEKQSASRRGLSESYSDELSFLRMLAGLEAVVGRGVEVTLADNPRPPDAGIDPNNYIIHDYDVRAIVNALWAGGAEAVAVNDERLVQSSAVRCVGATVLVNSTRTGSPFVVTAIGEPERLLEALAGDEDARLLVDDYARVFGLKVAVRETAEVRVPRYRGSLAPQELVASPLAGTQ